MQRAINMIPNDANADLISINGYIRPWVDCPEFIEKQTVYEIIRVIDGVPLFFEDHLARFEKSFHILNERSSLKVEDVRLWVENYISNLSMDYGNVKFQHSFGSTSNGQFCCYSTRFKYPDQTLYQTGIATELLYEEREHPNAKDVQKVRDVANRFITEHSIYEALLVNHLNQITEGSKSNVFFISGDTFITAPGYQVLKGITRKYVIEAIEKCGFRIEERVFHADEIENISSAFISGTSPKVLPIKNIGAQHLSTETLQVKAVAEEYDRIIKNYICTHKQTKNG